MSTKKLALAAVRGLPSSYSRVAEKENPRKLSFRYRQFPEPEGLLSGVPTNSVAQDRGRFAREPAYRYLLKREFEEHRCTIRL